MIISSCLGVITSKKIYAYLWCFFLLQLLGLGKGSMGHAMRCNHHTFYPLFEEAFIEECELLRSDALENELDVMGEYATEETMRDEWGWTEFLART